MSWLQVGIFLVGLCMQNLAAFVISADKHCLDLADLNNLVFCFIVLAPVYFCTPGRMYLNIFGVFHHLFS